MLIRAESGIVPLDYSSLHGESMQAQHFPGYGRTIGPIACSMSKGLWKLNIIRTARFASLQVQGVISRVADIERLPAEAVTTTF